MQTSRIVFVISFVLVCAFVHCGAATELECFGQEGDNIKFDSKCTKGIVTFKHNAQGYSIDFAADSFKDSKKLNFDVGGDCKQEGTVMLIVSDVDLRLKSGGLKLPGTFHVTPNGLKFVNVGGLGTDLPKCSPKFTTSEGNVTTSTFTLELPDGAISELNIVIKDAHVLQDGKNTDDEANAAKTVGIIVGSVALAVLIVLSTVGAVVYYCCKRSKSSPKKDVLPTQTSQTPANENNAPSTVAKKNETDVESQSVKPTEKKDKPKPALKEDKTQQASDNETKQTTASVVQQTQKSPAVPAKNDDNDSLLKIKPVVRNAKRTKEVLEKGVVEKTKKDYATWDEIEPSSFGTSLRNIK